MPPTFKVLEYDPQTNARRGCIKTCHGKIETPIFMPVGTQGAVKAMTPEQLKSIGAQIVLGNTYHLNLRPGSELIRDMGGLHSFMSWDRPILTDSGGFQAFSLSKLCQINDQGVAFQSHLNGDSIFLGPFEVISIQHNLGSDIAMVLDECVPFPCEKKSCRQAVNRTISWAGQCLEIAQDKGMIETGHHLFAIVQGSIYKDLRKECAEKLVAMNFSGYAVGGVSVGEPEESMIEQIQATVPYLPIEKPRYVMGVGTPPQLLKMIALGVDMFDCVLPTRAGRHAVAYTPYGTINLRNKKNSTDPRPIVKELANYTCKNFSRAYLRHLFLAKESLGGTLLTLHNLHFYLDLVRQAREHLQIGDFNCWSQQWIERYENKQEEMEG
jgi:queuine tRNA-ribosyltransferase